MGWGRSGEVREERGEKLEVGEYLEGERADVESEKETEEKKRDR